MALCVVCSAVAQVWCAADKAMLCAACDRCIHDSNVISRSHKRTPVCELCKRSPASVYCCEDAASLCEGCLEVVHSANPLCSAHCVLSIDEATAQGKVPSIGCCSVATAVAGPAEGAGQVEDEQLSGVCGRQGPHSSHSTGGATSLAVVPDVHPCGSVAQGSASAHTPDAAAPLAKDGLFSGLDPLDLDSSWFCGPLDPEMDICDFLGVGSSTDGHCLGSQAGASGSAHPDLRLQPSAAATAAASSMWDAHTHHPEQQHECGTPPDSALPGLLDDFVVPSFLPSEDEDCLHEFDGLLPSSMGKQQQLSPGCKRSHAQAGLDQDTVGAAAVDAPEHSSPPSPLSEPFLGMADSQGAREKPCAQQDAHAGACMMVPSMPQPQLQGPTTPTSAMPVCMGPQGSVPAEFDAQYYNSAAGGVYGAYSAQHHWYMPLPALQHPSSPSSASQDISGAVPGPFAPLLAQAGSGSDSMRSLQAPLPPTPAAPAAQGYSFFGNGATLTREQRVARYREKRKCRTFQKTIRYASRKAYAEVRPRIKGRFATKEEVEAWKRQKEEGLIAPDASIEQMLLHVA